MGKRTSLYDSHLKANAKMVDFAGWDMPLHYGSQLQEHHQIRQDAGVFDVSHMTVLDLQNGETHPFLRFLLANNVDRLVAGKALYTCMLNKAGGVIDDLIVYKINDHYYRLIVNSATHDKDLSWIKEQMKHFDVQLKERVDLAMLALQGPKTAEKINHLFDKHASQQILNLKPFESVTVGDYFIARTGYTGEDGFEIILPNAKAPAFWDQIMEASFKPCGLGARDTLRLEAGLNLYGADMDETCSPLESNLAWTVAFEPKDRMFIGRESLEKQLADGTKQKLIGIVLESQGVLRNHQKVFINDQSAGEITSGSFSPTLGKGIALARIPCQSSNQYSVEIRGKKVPVSIVKPPFVKKGKPTF